MLKETNFKFTLIVVLCGWITTSQAEEVKPFKFNNVEGEFAIRYYFDEESTVRDGSPTRNGNDIKEIEANIKTDGYVYHPNFLRFNFGGGPVAVWDAREIYNEKGSANELTYNLNTRLNFLEKKNFSFGFHFDRSTPLVFPTVNEHFLQKNTRFGTNVSLKKWILPIAISFEAYQQSTKGDGNTVVVDDKTQWANLHFHQNNKRTGHRVLSFLYNKNLSNSGNLPEKPEAGSGIVETESEAQSINYNAITNMGMKQQFQLRNQFDFVNRTFSRGNTSSTSKFKQYHLFPNFRWNHSNKFYSTYRLNYNYNIRDTIPTNESDPTFTFKVSNKRIDVEGSRFERGKWSVVGGVNAFQDEIKYQDVTTSKSTSYGLLTSGEYLFLTGKSVNNETKTTEKGSIKETTNGNLKLLGGMGYQLYDYDSETANEDIIVQNQRKELYGLDEVLLNNFYITKGSVVIWNQKRAQQYIEGTDFQVNYLDETTVNINGEDRVYGYQVKISRVTGSNIPEGEPISVDYRYRPAGTYTNTTLRSNIGLSWNYKWAQVYLNYSRVDIDVTSGISSLLPESSQSISANFRGNWSLLSSVNTGADARYLRQIGGLAPNVNYNILLYMQFQILRSNFLRVSAQNQIVNYDSIANEDVNLFRYTARLTSRPFRNSRVILSYSQENQTGGSIPRSVRNASLKWQWQIRQVFIDLEGVHNLEEQKGLSPLDRENNLVRASVTRRF